MLEAKKLSKIFNQNNKQTSFQALDSINLKIQPSEILAVVGKSGSGKSTLGHILGCLDIPTSGSLLIDNQDVSRFSSKNLARVRRDIFGYIFQQYYLLSNSTVLDNVLLPLKISRYSRQSRLSLAKKAIADVGLEDKIDAKIQNLSGGQKQRVAIARAIVTEPKVIIADEPTGALDSVNAANIFELLLKLNQKQQTSLIIITHDQELANKCPRKVTISDGKLIN
ncbi:MAG: ABC transporter ATP-binding protein [Patescibacteria group bacterium]